MHNCNCKYSTEWHEAGGLSEAIDRAPEFILGFMSYNWLGTLYASSSFELFVGALTTASLMYNRRHKMQLQHVHYFGSFLSCHYTAPCQSLIVPCAFSGMQKVWIIGHCT
jgi:hypothetical protein